MAPVFAVHGEKITVINEPKDFYLHLKVSSSELYRQQSARFVREVMFLRRKKYVRHWSGGPGAELSEN